MDGNSLFARKVATENDVKSGCAVFYIQPRVGSTHNSIDMALPVCGVQSTEAQEHLPVIIIQAEQFEQKVYFGVRYLNGGNGVCVDNEVEILGTPNELFPKQRA